MRIAYIAAGAGGSYCGACTRDVTLARGLIGRGHDVLLIPVYTPLRVEGEDPSLQRVFYGGITAYLQQRSALFRHTPAALDRLLSGRRLLRRVSRFAIETRPEDLGEMTVSVLRGPAGRQAKELARLVDFLSREERPDVVNLTNSLLAGMAPTLKERLGVPIVCALQGEEAFIARLGAPHREEALAVLRRQARAIDLFIAPGEAYADEMAAFLDVERGRLRVVRPGVDLETYQPAEPAGNSGDSISGLQRDRGANSRMLSPEFPKVARIGFLSRLSPAKGLDLLCEAFRVLARERPEPVLLAVAGQSAGPGNRYWRRLYRDLRRDGLADRVEFAGEVDLAGKVAFLRRSSVFSVPSRYAERRAMAALEALACGVPVVLPKGRGYEELLALTGGGLLVEPDDPGALARGLADLLDRPEEARRMGQTAAGKVAAHFSATLMVNQTLQVYRNAAGSAPERAEGNEESASSDAGSCVRI